VALYVTDERSYDRFHERSDRIYRVARVWDHGDDVSKLVRPIPGGLPQALEEQIPGIESTVLMNTWTNVVRTDRSYLGETAILQASPSFFDVFTVDMVAGSSSAALDEEHDVVVTKSFAVRAFGTIDALGRRLLVGDDDREMIVSAVVEDMPNQSHFSFEILTRPPNAALEQSSISWSSFYGALYLMLSKTADPGVVEAGISQIVERSGGAELGNRLYLQPLTSIHLHSHLKGELGPNGDIRYLWLFGVTALLVLGVACFNYINLTAAQVQRRGREFGVRKVLGAGRTQISLQALSEASAIVLIALATGTVLVILLLPLFNEVVGKSLAAGDLASSGFWTVIVGATLAVGLLAGGYGALLYGGIRPHEALTGRVRAGRFHSVLRNSSVALQFAVSTALILAAFVIHDQLDYIQTKRLGFNQEHVVVLSTDTFPREEVATFKKAIDEHSGIVSATISNWTPGDYRQPQGFTDDGTSITRVDADADFVRTLEIPVAAGREFGEAEVRELTEGDYRFGYDKVLVNETLLRTLDLPDFRVGDEVNIPGAGIPVVIGVLEDFHMTSLHRTIPPLTVRLNPAPFRGRLLVRVRAGAFPEAREYMAALWSEFWPERPFEYFFLEDHIQQLYTSEQRISRIFDVLAGLTIFISCLGLLALAAFTARMRRHEIGVRKVVGASIADIVKMLTGQFARVVLVGFVLSVPVGYLVLSRWLENYAYHVEVGPVVILAAGVITCTLALLTTGYQAYRAAGANPVDALRNE
jgi:putative ABC transport system permease protein